MKAIVVNIEQDNSLVDIPYEVLSEAIRLRLQELEFIFPVKITSIIEITEEQAKD